MLTNLQKEKLRGRQTAFHDRTPRQTRRSMGLRRRIEGFAHFGDDFAEYG